LVAIAAGGAEAAGLGGPAGALGIAAAGVVPFAGLVVLARHPSWFVQLAERVLTLTNRLSGRPRGDAHVLVPEAYDQLGGIHPRRVDFAMVALLALLNWGTDILCLALAFRAVGGRAPWPGIFVAYAVGQLASSIPIVPGGLGIVEGGLAATLVAYGAAASTALAAVFVYRLISFWAVLVVGWVFWVIIMRRRAGRPARVARSLGVHGNDRRRLLEGLYGQQTRTDDSQA
jgi:uncharacterized membrane protein YbhN (UPF0104 family)